MKIKNLKHSKLFIACISVLLVAVFAFTLVLSIIGDKARADTYTVYDDGEYYSETTYYLSENAYNKHLEETEATTADRKSVTKSAVSAEDNENEFVVAATKKVCVYEVTDENGNITESRLLKKSEIDELNNNSASSKKTARHTNVDNNIEIGTDSESKGYLSISMKVTYNGDTNQYLVEGYAGWEAKLVWAWNKNEAAEEYNEDFIGISWGGESTLKAEEKSIQGVYHNNNAISYTRSNSDSYAGYVWQFHEKSGWMGKEMKNTTATVTLSKDGNYYGKHTSARLTYIHTYGAISGEISIGVDDDGTVAASVGLSETDKQWQIEIDVPDIAY